MSVVMGVQASKNMGDFLLNFMAFLENINLVFSSFSKLS
jgi:hypothetical protein